MSREAPPLVSYATDVAHGSARTPIGIIMFACSHLLLGSVLVLSAFVFFQQMMRPGVVLAPLEPLVPAFLALLAVPMLIGGLALLLKELIAWTVAIASFAILAVMESAVVAYAVGMTVRYLGQNNPDGALAVIFALLAFLLTLLCNVVLRYLAAPKARVTFALPPGETPRPARLLPRIALLLCLAAVLAGPMLSGVRVLFPD